MATIINTNSLSINSGAESSDITFKQFKNKIATELNVSITDGESLADALLDRISQGGGSASSEPVTFNYEENDLNIATSENSDTNFTYNNGNLTINYQ